MIAPPHAEGEDSALLQCGERYSPRVAVATLVRAPRKHPRTAIADIVSQWARRFSQMFVNSPPGQDEILLFEGTVKKKAALRNQWNTRKMKLTMRGLYFFEEGNCEDYPSESFAFSKVVELWYDSRRGKFELLCQRKLGPGKRRLEFHAPVSRGMAIRESFERALSHLRMENAIELRMAEGELSKEGELFDATSHSLSSDKLPTVTIPESPMVRIHGAPVANMNDDSFVCRHHKTSPSKDSHSSQDSSLAPSRQCFPPTEMHTWN